MAKINKFVANAINPQQKELFKSYLINLGKIELSLSKKDSKDPLLLNFWRGLVRDSNGRWLKYYFEGYKYFQYGIQQKPDLKNKNHILLIKATINQNRDFIHDLANNSFKNLKLWLIFLHKKQIYNSNEIKTATKRRFALIIHSRIVVEEILPLAIKYQDPYINSNTQILHLPRINNKGLPVDIWHNEKEVSHYYPHPVFLHQYLEIMKEKLEEIISDINTSDEKLLSTIALYYQYGINTHMFENINQSLFANQVNALLQVFGFKPINHGILDFVAMRLQPENFIKYFIDEVKMGQTQSHKLIPHKGRYLKLSKLV